MARTSTVRRAMALPVIASCAECHWHRPCGGYRDEKSLYGDSCFARHCCGGRADCNYLCPSNPRFVPMMNEVEGLDFDALPETAHDRVALPRYAPSILHNYRRTAALEVPFAAVPVEEVFHVRGQRMEAVARDPEGLRAKLGLAAGTQVLLNCIRQDEDLERLWEFWRQDDLPHQLAALGLDLVLAPNYSHLRGVPRLESVGNRMRQLICVRDLQRAGLTAAPHLSALDPADWDWWKSFVSRNPRLRYVTFEFETGYKGQVEGEDAVCHLADVQRAAGRELHLIAVGGTQFRDRIVAAFPSCTFIDAAPFCRTMYRRRARVDAGRLSWEEAPTPDGATLDELLLHNVGRYGHWFAAQLGGRASR